MKEFLHSGNLGLCTLCSLEMPSGPRLMDFNIQSGTCKQMKIQNRSLWLKLKVDI